VGTFVGTLCIPAFTAPWNALQFIRRTSWEPPCRTVANPCPRLGDLVVNPLAAFIQEKEIQTHLRDEPHAADSV